MAPLLIGAHGTAEAPLQMGRWEMARDLGEETGRVDHRGRRNCSLPI